MFPTEDLESKPDLQRSARTTFRELYLNPFERKAKGAFTELCGKPLRSDVKAIRLALVCERFDLMRFAFRDLC